MRGARRGGRTCSIMQVATTAISKISAFITESALSVESSLRAWSVRRWGSRTALPVPSVRAIPPGTLGWLILRRTLSYKVHSGELMVFFVVVALMTNRASSATPLEVRDAAG